MWIRLNRSLALNTKVWWSVGYSSGSRSGYRWMDHVKIGTKDIVDKIKRKNDNKWIYLHEKH